MVGGERKEEPVVPGGLQRREGHRKSAWSGLEPFLAPWEGRAEAPCAKATTGWGWERGVGKCLSHQLTMGSTSASPLKSSGISSVLPGRCWPRTGDGEFLEGTTEQETSERAAWGEPSGKDGAAPLENLASGGSSPDPPSLLSLESSKFRA